MPISQIESSPYKIGALGEATITIKYAPQTIGAATGVVTLTDANGNSYQLNVAGMGIAPAAIAITPPSAKYSLALGDEANGRFTIKNTGNYPLQFFMPKYSDGTGVDYVSEVSTPSAIPIEPPRTGPVLHLDGTILLPPVQKWGHSSMTWSITNSSP